MTLDDNDMERLEAEFMAKTLEQRPLVVTLTEAWLMNARVRDLLEDTDLPPGMVQGQAIGPLLVNSKPLCLQIIRALHDLQTINETSIMVCEPECWFLERRFRHCDREPEARELLLKIHELILGFHLDLTIMAQEVDADADISYYDALRAREDADKNAGEDPPEDTNEGTGAGDIALLSE